MNNMNLNFVAGAVTVWGKRVSWFVAPGYVGLKSHWVRKNLYALPRLSRIIDRMFSWVLSLLYSLASTLLVLFASFTTACEELSNCKLNQNIQSSFTFVIKKDLMHSALFASLRQPFSQKL